MASLSLSLSLFLLNFLFATSNGQHWTMAVRVAHLMHAWVYMWVREWIQERYINRSMLDDKYYKIFFFLSSKLQFCSIEFRSSFPPFSPPSLPRPHLLRASPTRAISEHVAGWRWIITKFRRTQGARGIAAAGGGQMFRNGGGFVKGPLQCHFGVASGTDGHGNIAIDVSVGDEVNGQMGMLTRWVARYGIIFEPWACLRLIFFIAGYEYIRNFVLGSFCGFDGVQHCRAG